MSVDAVIPEIWSARLLFKLRERMVYRPLCWDVSPDLPDGDTLHLGFLTGSTTVGTYTRNTDLAPPELLTVAEITPQVSEYKYTHFYVDDLDQIQARPNLVDAAAERAAQDLSVYIQDYIRPLFNTDTDKIDVAATNKDFDTAAKRKVLTDAFLDQKIKLDEKSVPEMGRFAVVSPTVSKYLLQTLEDRGLSLESEMGARRAGKLFDLWGWEILVDAGADDAVPKIRMGVRGNGVYWIQQVEKSQSFVHPDRFGDVHRKLVGYGALPQYTDIDYRLNINLLQA